MASRSSLIPIISYTDQTSSSAPQDLLDSESFPSSLEAIQRVMDKAMEDYSKSLLKRFTSRLFLPTNTKSSSSSSQSAPSRTLSNFLSLAPKDELEPESLSSSLEAIQWQMDKKMEDYSKTHLKRFTRSSTPTVTNTESSSSSSQSAPSTTLSNFSSSVPTRRSLLSPELTRVEPLTSILPSFSPFFLSSSPPTQPQPNLAIASENRTSFISSLQNGSDIIINLKKIGKLLLEEETSTPKDTINKLNIIFSRLEIPVSISTKTTSDIAQLIRLTYPNTSQTEKTKDILIELLKKPVPRKTTCMSLLKEIIKDLAQKETKQSQVFRLLNFAFNHLRDSKKIVEIIKEALDILEKKQSNYAMNTETKSPDKRKDRDEEIEESPSRTERKKARNDDVDV